MSTTETPPDPDTIDPADEVREAFETIAEHVDDRDIAERFGYRPLRRLEEQEEEADQ